MCCEYYNMRMFGDVHSQLILYMLNHYTAKMTEPMHAYSHMKYFYENHIYEYKSVCGYTGQLRCQVLYRAPVGEHIYL